MKISLAWLREFVQIPADLPGLTQGLRGIGLGVELVSTSGADTILDIEVTTNRPDCLNHYGVAREVAALYRTRLKPLEIQLTESSQPTEQEASLEIVEPSLCRRYCGRVIQNVRIGPSPAWLTRRLEAAGIRAINNVTDVTNYVLMELGHPLHAFDLNRLREKKIVVRRAKPGERLVTLDGIERKLGTDNLVIADASVPVALAGIMGGEATGIAADTRSVLLESAWFDPVSVRFTAKAHALRTEASYRFERGADVEMAPRALDRAAKLIAELAGGEILRGILDDYPNPLPRVSIPFAGNTIKRTLGILPPDGEIERILRSLGFQREAQTGGGWRFTPPSFRADVSGPVDLVEEVARHVGYDNLPSRLRPAPPRLDRNNSRQLELELYARLRGLGYSEIIAYPMIDPEENARFTDRPPVKLENPLSEEASVMRSSGLPGMLRALKWNLDRDQRNLQLFEIGKTYSARPAGLPEEREVLTLGLTSERVSQTPYVSSQSTSFLDLKGDLDSLLNIFNLPSVEWEFNENSCPYRYFHKLRRARLVANNETLAVCGEISEECKERYKVRRYTVFAAEIDLERLRACGLQTPRFRPFPKFPAVERDLSLLVPGKMPYQQIVQAIEPARIANVRSLQPLERLPGGGRGVPSDHYSLLLRVTFQSSERTLTGEEVAASSRKILECLEKISVRLRSSESGFPLQSNSQAAE